MTAKNAPKYPDPFLYLHQFGINHIRHLADKAHSPAQNLTLTTSFEKEEMQLVLLRNELLKKIPPEGFSFTACKLWRMDNNGLNALADILPHCPKLQEITLSNSTFDATSVARLVENLPFLPQLKTIRFENNFFKTSALPLLIGLCQQAPGLESIKIQSSDGSLHDYDLKTLATHIQNLTIKSLSISSNCATQEGWEALLGVLKRDSLRSLHLQATQKTDVSDEFMNGLLDDFPRLLRLWVEGGKMSKGEGFTASLMRNKYLADLKLNLTGLSEKQHNDLLNSAFKHSQLVAFSLFDDFDTRDVEGMKKKIDSPRLANVVLKGYKSLSLEAKELNEKAITIFEQCEGRYHKLSKHQLAELALRKNAFYISMLGSADYDVSLVEKKETEFEQFLSSLPGVPATKEALFIPNETTFAPLDNPNLWADLPSMLTDAAKFHTTPADWKQTTPKGNSLVSWVYDFLPAKEATLFLNRRNISTANMLLTEEGKPTPFFRDLILTNKAPDLFTPDNFLQHGDIFIQAHNWLPIEQKAQVQLTSLQLSRRSASTAGRGR